MATLNTSTPAHAWAYLNRVTDGAHQQLNNLLEEHTAAEIATGIFNRETWIGEHLLEDTATTHHILRQDEDLAVAEKLGARLVTVEDDEWPTDTINSFYTALNADFADRGMDTHIPAPTSLWVQGSGTLDELAASRAVHVTGTRAITRYGFEATQTFTQGLAQNGTTITSGGALGVETVALEQSLEFDAPTVVFQPTGLDAPYPARNAKLYQHVARSPRGMLVTPYPMGTTPNRARFLYRNALAVALTRGALITEAAVHSGAINVANYAHAAGKRTMAIPGPVTGPGSTGCHTLIRDGKADLVLDAQEVIDALDEAV